MIATRHGNTPVRTGEKLAGMRVIPLVIAEETLRKAEEAAGDKPLLALLPYVKKTAAIIATGSEVRKGLIQDSFSPVVRRKLAAYGIETLSVAYPGDAVEDIVSAIAEARETHADLILCTGGMSVDPDDNTPGAMVLLGYYGDGTAVCGLPGCVMYAGATVFDLVLPRLAAGVRVERKDLIALGEGGMCLGCNPCHWPNCPFGK